MAISDIPLFGMLRERMGWLNARQGVLAENVANANTPGYEARDLRDLDFGALVGRAHGRLDLAVTRAGHIAAGPPGPQGGPYKRTGAPDSETSPSGNSVVLEEQMLKVAETQMDYQTATGLYAKGLGLIRMAITGRA